MPKYLNERGFELERGEKGSERKNLTVPEYKKAKDELKEMTTTLEQRKSEVLALSNDKTPTINKESLDLKDETKTVKVPSGETIGIGKLRHEFTKNEERKTGNVIIPESKLNALIQGYEDLYKSNEQQKKLATATVASFFALIYCCWMDLLVLRARFCGIVRWFVWIIIHSSA